MDEIVGVLTARYDGADLSDDVRELVDGMAERGLLVDAGASRPYTLIAELSYQCPLHCPYCSNPVDIGGEKYRHELETEHWVRTFASGA